MHHTPKKKGMRQPEDLGHSYLVLGFFLLFLAFLFLSSILTVFLLNLKTRDERGAEEVLVNTHINIDENTLTAWDVHPSTT